MTTQQLITHYAACTIAAISVGAYIWDYSPTLAIGLAIATFMAISALQVHDSEHQQRP